jgi:hypothetical protein
LRNFFFASVRKRDLDVFGHRKCCGTAVLGCGR